MNYIFVYLSKDELDWVSIFFSVCGVVVNSLILLVAYKALSSWRSELKHNDKNRVITFLFDDVKSLHSDFISLISLQSKYQKQIIDADNDPVEYLRNNDKFDNPEILAQLESNELIRIQEELKKTTDDYLQAHEKYTIKIISLSSYLIPLQRYPLDELIFNKISESIYSLSTASQSCFEYLDSAGEITSELRFDEINKVNARYLELLINIDISKVRMLDI